MIFQKDRNRERILDPKMLYIDIDIKNKDKASDSNPFLKEKKGDERKGNELLSIKSYCFSASSLLHN